MIWEHWLVVVSIVIVALAFVALVIFVIQALRSMQVMIGDLDEKVRSLDPLFRVVSKAGRVIEKKADQELSHAEEALVRESKKGHVNTAIEVAEWALIGVALWQKFKERR